jgi:hypothetical protein
MASVVAAALVAALQAAAAGQAADRAADLFREARQAIDNVIDGGSPGLLPEPDAGAHARAGLWIALALAEAEAFPAAAADDAARALAVVRLLPGTARDATPARMSDAAGRAAALGWMAKAQIEPEAIRIIVFAHQVPRAIEIARRADIECADAFLPILRDVPLDQVLPLAAGCRSADGSYPYVSIADRARGAADAAARHALLDPAYAAAASETGFKARSLALGLIERTYDLMPREAVARALGDLMRAMIDRPALAGDGTLTDRDMFGPRILELMLAVDRAQAAAIAADHPEWEAARRIPGRTAGNPIGGPGPGVRLRPAASPPPPPPRPPAPPQRLDAAGFETSLAEIRAKPASPERVRQLIALAYTLVAPPR